MTRLITSLCLFVSFPSFAAPLRFERACERGKTTSIAAVGDILIHASLQRQALNQASEGRYRTLWKHVEPMLNKASTTYGNLEGPAAAGMQLTSKQMSFNFHPSVVDDLKSSGFDVISTANNHSLDRGTKGLDLTIEKFREAGLSYTGTYHSDKRSSLAAITNKDGISIAWLSCTDLSNMGKSSQLQFCKSNHFYSQISRYANDRKIDAVIVTPHWGYEKFQSPNSRQKDLAKKFFEAGALVVIGAHPHVLQPWQKVVINGTERLVIYSLGNFVSNQLYYGIPQKTSAIAYFGLTKTKRGTIINGARFTPIFMTRYPYFSAYPSAGNPKMRETHAFTHQFFNKENELLPDEKLITNPECR